jgi:hypothetical protein
MIYAKIKRKTTRSPMAHRVVLDVLEKSNQHLSSGGMWSEEAYNPL